ncbi:nucleolar protein 56 [Nematocida sp. AWRm77]|nr:nucleolar protein 56 [Nematocida sp. AWRm77]
MHILYEHPLGYVLVKTELDDNVSLKDILKSTEKYAVFRRAFSAVGSFIYQSAEDAQAQIKASAEGKVSGELKNFLEINGVKKLAADRVYAPELKSLGIKPVDEETSAEMIRAVKKFADKLLEVEDPQARKAEVSLAHTISRKNIKYDNKREDNSVMQCISLIDELSIDINDYYMRIREMYAWHFPELAEICTEQSEYLEALEVVGSRSTASKEDVAKLPHGEDILSAMGTSIGGELLEEDIENIKELSDVVMEKLMIKDKAMEHLEHRMQTVAPNLSALVGSVVGARLILKAGGLSKLAMCPSSTIQVLGAEKALFRAMKTQAPTPKYGLLFHSSFVNKSVPKMRGRVSRYLSAKCAIASRIDCYTDESTDAYGVAMREMVEERAKGKSTHHMPTDMVLQKVSDKLAAKAKASSE